jgi:hypothetical protein
MKHKLRFLFLILVLNLFVHAEEPPENRASRGYYFGLGPVKLSGLNSSDAGYFFTGGYAFNYEKILLKLNAEGMGSSGALVLMGGIGAAYFPKELVFKELNPFVGANFGIGTSRIRPNQTGIGEWTTGFIVGPEIGAQFFRNSDVILEVSGKWATFLESGSLGTPSYTVLKVSLYFL